MTTEKPADTVANLMIDFSPSVRLNVWLSGDKGADMVRLADVTAAVRGWLASDDALRARLLPDKPAQSAQNPAQATPGGRADSAPRFRPAPAGGQQRRGSGLFCPDHSHVELVLSKAQYQVYDDGPNGEQIPAKFFCPGDKNGTGDNHQVWRREANDHPESPVPAGAPDDDADYPPF